MKQTIFVLTVLLSVSAFAQKTEFKTEPKLEANLELNAQLAQPKIDLLNTKTSFVASSMVLRDESGQEIDVITDEMLKDMQQAGKVPTIKIGNLTFVIQAPVDPREAYPRRVQE